MPKYSAKNIPFLVERIVKTFCLACLKKWNILESGSTGWKKQMELIGDKKKIDELIGDNW